MKKAGIISLLFIILFQMVGVFILFKVKQAEIRQEVKSRIKAGVPAEKITVLQFDRRIDYDLRWINDHEFMYEDHMYDIVKTDHENHFVNYHCLPDTLETKLFKNLNRTVANEMNKDKSKSGQNNFTPVNWYYSGIPAKQHPNNNIFSNINSPYIFAVISKTNTPDTPPPKG